MRTWAAQPAGMGVQWIVTITALCLVPVAGCLSWQFQCKSGQCVDKTQLCDSRFDCDDKSDESDWAGCGTGDGGSAMPAGIIAAIVIIVLLAVLLLFMGIIALFMRQFSRKDERANFRRPRPNVQRPPPNVQHPPPFNPQPREQTSVDNGDRGQGRPLPDPVPSTSAGAGPPHNQNQQGARIQPISRVINANQSQAPVQPRPQQPASRHGAKQPRPSKGQQRPANSHKPSTRPPREGGTNGAYLTPFSKPLTHPAPSAPSLDDLRRVSMEPSGVADNPHTGTLNSAALHHRSLPNLYHQLALQVAVLRQEAMGSTGNLTALSQHNNIPRRVEPMARSASVPLGLIGSEYRLVPSGSAVQQSVSGHGGVVNYAYHSNSEMEV